MKKNDESGWTTTYVLAIVSVLFFVSVVVSAQEPQTVPAKAQPGKRNIEVKALKSRCLELQAVVLRTQEELKTSRANLTQAVLELKRLRAEVADLRVTAANVLANQDDLKQAGTVRSALENLIELNKVQKETRQEILGFGRYLNSALDVLDKDDQTGLRKKLNSRLFLVTRKIEQAEGLSRAPNAATARPRGTCRILKVDKKLGVVVLDTGREAGASPGALWEVTKGRKSIKLKIIEVRPALSAAAVVDGDLDNILPGSTARRLSSRVLKPKK